MSRDIGPRRGSETLSPGTGGQPSTGQASWVFLKRDNRDRVGGCGSTRAKGDHSGAVGVGGGGGGVSGDVGAAARVCRRASAFLRICSRTMAVFSRYS